MVMGDIPRCGFDILTFILSRSSIGSPARSITDADMILFPLVNGNMSTSNLKLPVNSVVCSPYEVL